MRVRADDCALDGPRQCGNRNPSSPCWHGAHWTMGRDLQVNAEHLISARTYACACCEAEVLVCTACDRGQRYCGKVCRQRARRASQRSASRKYQSTRAGSVNHARRQRRYRERERHIEIVTHQGSQEACEGDLLQSGLNESDAACKPRSALACHWCARPVASVVRCGWLRHSAFEQDVAHELKGPPRAQSP